MRAPALVLGVGSELRSDDAVGRVVAEAVAGWELPGVEARAVHQLTPELAVEVAGRRLVVVVDAAVGTDEVVVCPVEVRAGSGVMSHHLDVASLLGLASLVGDPPTEVVTVAVPAHDLSLGTELSAATLAAVDVAFGELRRLLAAGA